MPPKTYSRKRRGTRNSSKAIITKVKKMIAVQQEPKFIVTANTEISDVLTASVPYIGLLNPLVQGTTDNTRIGDRVRFTKLNLRLNLYGPAGLNNHIRVFVFKSKDPHGVAPTITNLFNTATPSNISHANFVSLDWTHRYQLMASRDCALTSSYSTQRAAHMCEINVSLGNAISDYSIGNAGTVADMDKNAYYLVLLSDSATATNVYQDSYMWFTDM